MPTRERSIVYIQVCILALTQIVVSAGEEEVYFRDTMYPMIL